MIFYKTVAAGNDFLHVDLMDYRQYAASPTAEAGISMGLLAEAMCRRQNGAGADGVIFYDIHKKQGSADFRIFNRDGNEAELSGNGMAGVSALLFHQRAFSDTITLETKTGSKTHTLLEQNGHTLKMNIEIGTPDFGNTGFFPFLEAGKYRYSFDRFFFYPVSVGNPHVVVLMQEPDSDPPADADDQALEAAGKLLEGADIFPKRTNVEFVFFNNPDDCRVVYYERGVGPTLSSSTGSSAVYAVLEKLKLVKGRLAINTAGGRINISGNLRIYVENCSKIVYKGIWLDF
ncbi:MAG: diaminopimelate epimerase [bacterium]|nr:diaminopimelate epimerase [bacterium]